MFYLNEVSKESIYNAAPVEIWVDECRFEHYIDYLKSVTSVKGVTFRATHVDLAFESMYELMEFKLKWL